MTALLRIHWALSCALLLSACGSELGSAIDAFEAGRLPDAVQKLRDLEPRARRFEARDWARYTLYRGLSEFALGDVRRANRFLVPLKQKVDLDPHTLSDSERGALFAAFRSMGRMPGEP